MVSAKFGGFAGEWPTNGGYLIANFGKKVVQEDQT